MARAIAVVLVGILLSSESLQAYHKSLSILQPYRALLNHDRHIRGENFANDMLPTLSQIRSKSRSSALLGTSGGDEDPKSDKKGAKAKRKSRAKGEMMRYNEELNKAWSLSDSFNSTTMKFLFEFKVSTLFDSSSGDNCGT